LSQDLPSLSWSRTDFNKGEGVLMNGLLSVDLSRSEEIRRIDLDFERVATLVLLFVNTFFVSLFIAKLLKLM
jgi:hypothetical protein